MKTPSSFKNGDRPLFKKKGVCPHFLGQLVASPSVSSVSPEYDMSNRAITELLANWCEDIGMAVEVREIPDAPGKFNLVAQLGEGDPDAGVALCGHTDTVPCDPQLWSSDPFTLVERDARLYGLGTCDMKGFLALAITAISELSPRQLKAPVRLVATADEESTMSGARFLVESGWKIGRYAVLGEPTGLRPVHMHKGIMMLAIRVIGQAGHSSDPSLGRNALEGMHAVIAALLSFRDRLQAQYQNADFAVPVPTLNLGRIFGGDNPNRICGQCELHVDLRLLPGMDAASLLADLHHTVQQALEGSGLSHEWIPLFPGIPAFSTSPQGPLNQLCAKLTDQRPISAAYGTEATFLQQLGCEVVVLGPGDIAQAHQPDEYLALERVEPCITLLKKAIHALTAD
ncbi:acetylornithine deacetylase [Ectothiorhodosinus mongolicus]|uniref:Acetylornithine deacetylase n=1 Tax=Ectothiorhodosinus mongolicus TaxID=233100 RepID=A0A1R3VU84_9GAMM|nr:acetylornithine deacetylase [Ectothiorhodosinus mongolicus]SIT68523.1 acetylornithine deacetylase [Ectothiorhodosinus mongolicus]